jgi:hypothetical protein
VHLALATNGVNPYKLNHSTWSTWLAMLLNHNIFSWLTTIFFGDACIIHFGGKTKFLLKNFDVYLQLIVEELQ